MSFETTTRIVKVIDPSQIPALYAQLVPKFGEELKDGDDMVLTIVAFWDDTAHTRIRAASLLDGTIVPMPLTDGSAAFQGLWQSDLAAAFDRGEITGVVQLTPGQLAALLPPSGHGQ